MPTTLLIVDDSVTMQKVLAIAFASEDYLLVTAETGEAALVAARQHAPAIALLDVTLPDQDGYALCKALKAELPALRVVILSSKQGAYDAVRGASSGADDFIDKPFDTQQLIDKVRKIAHAQANPPAVMPSVAPQRTSLAPAFTGATGPTMPPTQVAPPKREAAASAASKPSAPLFTGPSPLDPWPANLQGITRSFTPATSGEVRPQPPSAHAGDTAPSMPTPILTNVSDRVASLGLTPAQADAVMAMSRELVERVVWEVVPALAETMIKEEIHRLMREG